MSGNPLPLIDAAPWWQPIEPAALAAMLDIAPRAGFFDYPAGWTLALCSLTAADGARQPRWGWVKDSFVVIGEILGDELVGNLTHLPTGARIAHVLPKEDAAAVAALIAPLADWPAIQPADAPSIRMREALSNAGFQRCIAFADETGPIPVLVRTGTLQ